MTERLRSTLKTALVVSMFVLALGADVQCPGELEAQRTSLASLQAEIDELAAIHSSSSFQLVGFTAARFQGGEGVLGFAEACQVEFGQSRMCTSIEIMETVVLPWLPEASEGWVRPVFQPVSPRATDASGLNDLEPTNLNCVAWTIGGNLNTSTRGLIVDDRGHFRRRPCAGLAPQPKSVACCAIVP